MGRIQSAHSDLIAIESLGAVGVAALARHAIEQDSGIELYWDLELLKLLHQRAIPYLVNELVDLVGIDRHGAQVHDLLSRLDRADIERLVPPAVRRRLDSADSFDLLQLGALLRRLRLPDALNELVAFTASSGDEEIRSIGPEWFPEAIT
ncbi:MAG TPA: hypothetical protein VE011_07820 [Candidatus Dormibacteraeota bacterium]|nr:hypothetical protein [Candidatus Dormibacteraeota bacterium]